MRGCAAPAAARALSILQLVLRARDPAFALSLITYLEKHYAYFVSRPKSEPLSLTQATDQDDY